jgi:hypothetical protein
LYVHEQWSSSLALALFVSRCPFFVLMESEESRSAIVVVVVRIMQGSMQRMGIIEAAVLPT